MVIFSRSYGTNLYWLVRKEILKQPSVRQRELSRIKTSLRGGIENLTGPSPETTSTYTQHSHAMDLRLSHHAAVSRSIIVPIIRGARFWSTGNTYLCYWTYLHPKKSNSCKWIIRFSKAQIFTRRFTILKRVKLVSLAIQYDEIWIITYDTWEIILIQPFASSGITNFTGHARRYTFTAMTVNAPHAICKYQRQTPRIEATTTETVAEASGASRDNVTREIISFSHNRTLPKTYIHTCTVWSNKLKRV